MSREINSGKHRDIIEPAPAEIVSTAQDPGYLQRKQTGS